ncbi:Histone lysine methyltransferase Set6 [Schizosaccharomyces pombe]
MDAPLIASVILPEFGKGTVATDNIPIGKIIIRKRVDILSLDSANLKRTCSTCTEEKGCQKADWPFHKLECKALQASKQNGILPSVCRLLIRLYLLWQKNPAIIEPMEGHQNEFQAVSSSWSDAELIASAASHYTQIYQAELFQKLFCRLAVNAMNLVTSSFDSLGMCLDTILCRLNHSCDPNCQIIFDGAIVQLVSKRDIKKDEQLFISYIDIRLPKSIRQKQLLKKYFFSCYCPRCENDHTTKETDGSKWMGRLRNSKSLMKNLAMARDLWSCGWKQTAFPWSNLLHHIKLGMLDESNFNGAFAALYLKSSADEFLDALHVVDEYQLLLLGKQVAMEVKHLMFPNDKPLEMEFPSSSQPQQTVPTNNSLFLLKNIPSFGGLHHCILGRYSISLDDFVLWLLDRAQRLQQEVRISHPSTTFCSNVENDIKEIFEVCKDYCMLHVQNNLKAFEEKLWAACKDFLVTY